MHRWWASNYYGTSAEHSLEPHIAALGLPYRTQLPLFLWGGKYFPDVALPSIGVIVEVDDDSHNDPVKREEDGVRTQKLEKQGWRVLRCTNEEALLDPAAVASSVLDLVLLRGAVDLTHLISRRPPRKGRRRKRKKAGRTGKK